MTLPTLIQKNEERVTVTKVKKFYSVINQALLFAIKDYGYVNEWNFIEIDTENHIQKPDKLAAYLKPYLKISKDCGTNSGCIAPNTYTLLNGQNWALYDNSKTHYKMILADGSYIWIRTHGSTECGGETGGLADACGEIWIDINGKLPPNVIGKDTFDFYVMKNQVIPIPFDDCYTGNKGWGCAAYILQHDNMKYLHK